MKEIGTLAFGVAGVAVIGWLILLVLMVLWGLADGAHERGKPAHESCHDAKRRIEYLLPGHELGCWLVDYPDSER